MTSADAPPNDDLTSSPVDAPPDARSAGLAPLLDLEPLKPDTWLGTGPDLGWGRIYGGLIVAQALRAATLTVGDDRRVHSLHAYFVRPGNERRPVLFEVDRVRDGRSFSTRQVVASQAAGAILTLIASFHVDEPDAPDTGSSPPPADLPAPEDVASTPTDLLFEHRVVRRVPSGPTGVGVDDGTVTWLRAAGPLGDDPAVHACALAYLSDEDLLGVAIASHPKGGLWDEMMAASLDHAVWFHRPTRADEWLAFSSTGHGMANARGLAVTRVHTTSGVHVATIVQEGLGRSRTP